MILHVENCKDRHTHKRSDIINDSAELQDIKSPYISPGLVVQLIGVSSCTPKVEGLIPGQGTYLDCRINLLLVCIQEAVDQCFSHFDVSLSLSLPL